MKMKIAALCAAFGLSGCVKKNPTIEMQDNNSSSLHTANVTEVPSKSQPDVVCYVAEGAGYQAIAISCVKADTKKAEAEAAPVTPKASAGLSP